MLDKKDLYRQINALDSQFFHTCLYCGCIAAGYDLVPPIKYAQFYLQTREEADFYKVPACGECIYFLKSENSALLGQRVDKAKKCLARKYKKALHIYNVWKHDEIDELDYQLKHSINAGMVLGEESSMRIQYKGFSFEADGIKHQAHYIDDQVFTIFGEEFDQFRDALEYASTSYRIPKAKLLTLLKAHNNCFDSAINSYTEKQNRLLLNKTLSFKCKEFALAHKQNSKFVMRTVEAYCAQDENLSIEMALDKLHREVLKAPKTQ